MQSRIRRQWVHLRREGGVLPGRRRHLRSARNLQLHRQLEEVDLRVQQGIRRRRSDLSSCSGMCRGRRLRHELAVFGRTVRLPGRIRAGHLRLLRAHRILRRSVLCGERHLHAGEETEHSVLPLP
uniref:(northern house mosquito) hypothetical protein n=1 Tax=Culex pipiens TaxID=7175 RepID=A0A8D8CCH5_CULPI